MSIRDRLRLLFNGVGVICVLLAVAPYFHAESTVSGAETLAYAEAHPDAAPMKEEYRLGWSRSPLVYYCAETTLQESGEQLISRQTRELKIGWASLSSLTLAFGFGFFWLAGCFRRQTIQQP
jgi:hypothetical protein